MDRAEVEEGKGGAGAGNGISGDVVTPMRVDDLEGLPPASSAIDDRLLVYNFAAVCHDVLIDRRQSALADRRERCRSDKATVRRKSMLKGDSRKRLMVYGW